MLPVIKQTPFYPPVWGVKGSDAGLGIRLLPGAKVLYVQSTHPNADDNNDGTDPDYPLATLAQANSNATASKGDVIILGANHAETISTATAITISKRGVTVIGMGVGADRPTFTFQGVVGASIVVSGGGVRFENLLFVAGLDGLTGPLSVTAADFALVNCEFRDQVDIEAVSWLVSSAPADRMLIEGLFMNGYTGGNASVNPLKLNGTDGLTIIDSRFQGKASTAFINFVTTAVTKGLIINCQFLNTGTALTKNIVDTIGGSVWQAVSCYDGVGDYTFSGGNAAALAADDVSVIAADTAAIAARTLAMERSIEKSDGTVTNPTDDLFTIAGGPVMATEFIGVVTTVIGGPGPSTCQIQITTTDPVGTVNLSTAVAIETDAVGTTYSFTAAAPGVLTPTTAGALANVPVERWLLPIGTVKAAFSATLTGNIKWYMVYKPLSPNSVVAAAA
jgi:hypothetical protein